MQGKIKKLKESNGFGIYPITRGEAVFVDDNKTLVQKLSEMEGTGGGIVTNTSSLYPYYEPTEEDGAESVTNRVYKNWSVSELYQAWDNLMAQFPKYVKREIAPYKDMSNTYELRRYILEPEYGYERTIFICAGIHGTEWAGKLSALRIAQIICEKWETNPQLSFLRNKVRIFIIPIGNPWGHDNKTLVNANGTANTLGKGVNLNRNYDAVRLNTIMSGGSDHNGVSPFSETETQWVRDTIFHIGLKNLHYAFDFHDAPTQSQFGDYWINFNTFHQTSKREVLKMTYYLAEKNITNREPYIWHDKDTLTIGTFASWTNKVIGIPSSTVEHCYELSDQFNATFMKRAVEAYLNTVIVNTITDHKHPVVENNKNWFDLQWYKGGANFAYWNHNDYERVIALWDDLVTKNPNYAKKSDFSVTNSDGKPIHYYTFSPKKYKKTILLVGGRSYPNTEITPFAISLLRLTELLCEHGRDFDHINYLREKVRIVVVPYIEFGAFYLNSSGNFASDGTPTASKIPVSNIISIMDNIGTIDGVMYAMELNKTNAEAAATTDVFTLPSQDTSDVLGIENYIEYLKEKGLAPELNRLATAEYANYVFAKRNIPCVRVDTGLHHSKYAEHKSDFADSAGIVTVPVDQYLKLNYEVARRISNLVNISKLMCEQ